MQKNLFTIQTYIIKIFAIKVHKIYNFILMTCKNNKNKPNMARFSKYKFLFALKLNFGWEKKLFKDCLQQSKTRGGFQKTI